MQSEETLSLITSGNYNAVQLIDCHTKGFAPIKVCHRTKNQLKKLKFRRNPNQHGLSGGDDDDDYDLPNTKASNKRLAKDIKHDNPPKKSKR